MAWANTATPACCRICALVSEAVSAAKSASWMRLRDAVRFSDTAWRFEIVDSKRFWMAPNWLRSEDTEVRAASTRWMALLALATEVTATEASVMVSLAIEVTPKPMSAWLRLA